MNDFYNASGTPAQGSQGSSAAIRAEFNAIVAAFDKLPSLASAAGQLVAVNPGGTALVGVSAITVAGANASVGGNLTVVGNLAVNGNTTIGDAAGDTLVVNPNAVNWANNPTHSGNHIFSGNLTVQGNTTIGNAAGDALTIAPSAVTWNGNPTHSGNHTFSGSVTISGALGLTGSLTITTNLTVNGNTILGNAPTDTLQIASQAVNWTAATTTHANAHTFSGNISAPRLLAPAGSNAAPSVQVGDAGLGLFSPATDTLGIASGGTAMLYIMPNGQLTTSLVAPTFGTTGRLHIAGGSSIFSSSIIASRTSDDTAGPAFRFGKSRSVTIGGYAAVQSSDDLGSVNWYGADGTDGQLSARIRAVATEGFTPTARGSQIEFATVATGSTTFNTRMIIEDTNIRVTTDFRISGSGTLKIGSLISRFESTEQAVPSATATTTVAHGGTRVPDLFQVWLRCKTAELGYSVGDEVLIKDDLGDTNRAHQFQQSATNLTWRYLPGSATAPSLRNGSNVAAVITPGSWRAVFKAHWL